jgi:hypothetical protein
MRHHPSGVLHACRDLIDYIEIPLNAVRCEELQIFSGMSGMRHWELQILSRMSTMRNWELQSLSGMSTWVIVWSIIVSYFKIHFKTLTNEKKKLNTPRI